MEWIIKLHQFCQKLKNIKEFNIGHFIIGESIFFVIIKTIKKLKRTLVNENFRHWC